MMHVGLTCEEVVAREIAERERREAEERARLDAAQLQQRMRELEEEREARRMASLPCCPRCGVMTYKTEGCNHM